VCVGGDAACHGGIYHRNGERKLLFNYVVRARRSMWLILFDTRSILLRTEPHASNLVFSIRIPPFFAVWLLLRNVVVLIH